MSNLDEQLKYFINIKITTDPLWKDVEIYLSGHLVCILTKYFSGFF